MANVFVEAPDYVETPEQQRDRLRPAFLLVRNAIVRIRYNRSNRTPRNVGRLELTRITGLTNAQMVEAIQTFSEAKTVEQYANRGYLNVSFELRKEILGGNDQGVEVNTETVLRFGRLLAESQGLHTVTIQSLTDVLGLHFTSAIRSIAATSEILQGAICYDAIRDMRRSGKAARTVGEGVALQSRGVIALSLEDRQFACDAVALQYDPTRGIPGL